MIANDTSSKSKTNEEDIVTRTTSLWEIAIELHDKILTLNCLMEDSEIVASEKEIKCTFPNSLHLQVVRARQRLNKFLLCVIFVTNYYVYEQVRK